MLENKKHDWIHYSRYIASWRNSGGKWFSEEFEEWLRSEGLNDEEIHEVVEMAICGKMELEISAKQFITKEHKAEMEAAKEDREKMVKKAIRNSGLAKAIRKMF